MSRVTFLRYGFSLMLLKGKWVFLPYLVSKDLTGISLVPPIVKEDQDWWPRWIGGYSYSYIETKYLTISDLSDVKYVQANRLVIEVVLAETFLGTV